MPNGAATRDALNQPGAAGPMGSALLPIKIVTPWSGGVRLWNPLGTATLQVTTTNFVSGRLYFVPFVMAVDSTVDELALEVTAAGTAGDKARIGIYNADADALPSTLRADAGEVAVDAIALVSKTALAIALTKGTLYYCAMHTNAAVFLNARALSVRPAMTTHAGQLAANLSNPGSVYKTGVAYGALPASAAGGAWTYANGQAPPVLWARFSA